MRNVTMESSRREKGEERRMGEVKRREEKRREEVGERIAMIKLKKKD